MDNEKRQTLDQTNFGQNRKISLKKTRIIPLFLLSFIFAFLVAGNLFFWSFKKSFDHFFKKMFFISVSCFLCIFWISIVGASTISFSDQDEDIREIQSAIVQQLNQNRHLNAIQQNEEVKSLLDALEPETRERYQLWINELQELEKERVNKLKEMMLQLSPEAQQTFAKILFIQQSETLSQDQKYKRLNEVSADMPKHVQQELSEQVKHQEMLKKFLQSRSY